MFHEFHEQLASGLASSDRAVSETARAIALDELRNVEADLKRARAWNSDEMTRSLTAERTSLHELLNV